MFGKVFASMYDGSLHGNWQAIVALQQLIVLCDRHGVVDMTPRALAARTSIPEDVLLVGLEHLEQPDPHSRTPGSEGRRIVRLDPDRSWGWRIVNHALYRAARDPEQRREQNADAQRRRRQLAQPASAGVSQRQPRSSHTDAEADTEAKDQAPARGFVLCASAGSPGSPGSPGDGLALPVKGGKFALLTTSTLSELAAAYPGLDVLAELRSMRSWLLANPTKRKTPAGVRRFVNGWLKGSMEAGRGVRPLVRAADSAYLEDLRREKGGAS